MPREEAPYLCTAAPEGGALSAGEVIGRTLRIFCFDGNVNKKYEENDEALFLFLFFFISYSSLLRVRNNKSRCVECRVRIPFDTLSNSQRGRG